MVSRNQHGKRVRDHGQTYWQTAEQLPVGFNIDSSSFPSGYGAASDLVGIGKLNAGNAARHSEYAAKNVRQIQCPIACPAQHEPQIVTG